MNDEERITLREFILVQLRAIEHKFEQYTKNAEESLKRTERELNRRLEGMNEFRAQLERQTATFLTKAEYGTRHEDLIRRIDILEKTGYAREGQIALIVGLVGVLTAIGIAFIKWFS